MRAPYHTPQSCNLRRGTDRVRVRRSESLSLPGGAPGSSLTVTIRNELAFNIDAR
jgi:hypothetical protein